MSIALNRRHFLGSTAAAGLMLCGGRTLLASTGQPVPGLPPAKIYKVYAGRGGVAWPKPEIDLPAEIAKFEKCLGEVQAKLGDVQFVGGDHIQNEQDAAAVVKKLGDADAVLLFHLSLGSGRLLQQVVQAGKPTAVFSQPFSGHEWMGVSAWQRAGARVALYATRDYGELAEAAALLRVPAHMGRSRIILVGRNWSDANIEKIKTQVGPQIVQVDVPRVVEAHKAADQKAAETLADEWIKQAKKVVEPSRAEIIKSARMFYAMKKIMEEEKAQAITIACLSGMPIDVIGYPCLGFTQLNDIGMVGACEADVDSTLTMLLFTYAFNVPGFITDPLFDTSKNAVIHAHCVAPTKMDGPGGPAAPYLIRTHRDDNRGASLEVEMRIGQVITCAKLTGAETLLISSGKIIEIPDFDDRGCRTQITTEVANAQNWLDNWGYGLHRVVFYGDRTKAVRHLAHLMGLKILQEV